MYRHAVGPRLGSMRVPTACGTASVNRNDIEASGDPKARTIAGRPVGRPRLAHAGGTRRSLHSVGFDALAAFVMTLADAQELKWEGARFHQQNVRGPRIKASA